MSGMNKGPVERSGERLDYPDSGRGFSRWGQNFREIAEAGAPPKAAPQSLLTTDFDTSPEEPVRPEDITEVQEAIRDQQRFS